MTTVCMLGELAFSILTLLPELEPRKIREGGVDMFIDLGATLEDHGEVCLPAQCSDFRPIS